MADVNTAVDATRSVFSGLVESPIAAALPVANNDAEAATRVEQARIAELEAFANVLIAEIKSNPALSPQEKSSLEGRVRSALNGGSVNSLTMVLANVLTQESIDEVDREPGEMRLGRSRYSGYGQYSKEGQTFINNELSQAMQSSPELRASMAAFDAMPEAEKASAQAEQNSNQKLIGELLKDDSRKDVHESLRIMRGTGMANGAEAQELLNKLKNGEISADEFKQQVADGVSKIAAKNDKFINEHINSEYVPKDSRDALQAEFGADGKIDSTKLHMEWGKIRLRDKDAAYQALAEANGDVSKLSTEHQRTVHMAQVMVAAETKTTIDGAMGIIARNQEVAKQLTDPSLSVEEKIALLEKEEKRQGTYRADPMHREALKQSVLAINETVQENGAYDPNKSGEFLKAVGANVKENYNELLNKEPGLVGSYKPFAGYTEGAIAAAPPRSWMKQPAQVAAAPVTTATANPDTAAAASPFAGIEVPPLKGVTAVAPVATGEPPMGNVVLSAKVVSQDTALSA